MLLNGRILALAGVLGLAALPAQAEELVVGVPMALTGPYAFVGVPIRNGIVLGLDEANEHKTLAPNTIRIVPEDTASDKGQTITIMDKLARRDNALLILGPTSSIEGTAAAPVANDLHVPMLTSAVSPDVLKAGPWSFKVTAAPSDIMAELGRFAVEKLHVKRVAYVFNRDNDGFVAQKNVIRDYLKGKGVEVVAEEGILGSDTDFVALATKLASLDVDAIFIASPAEQGANIVIQARQAGLDAKVKILAPPSMASNAYLKTGGKAVEGSYIVADYFTGNTSELNQAFVAAYTKRYGNAPDNWAAVGYTIGTLAVRALKAAGPNPDRTKVRDALAAINNVPTVLGDGTFHLDANRAPHYGASIIEVKDGKYVLAK